MCVCNSLILGLFVVAPVFAQAGGPAGARLLYEKTRYAEALALLEKAPSYGAAGYALTGQCWYMLGEYKKAMEALEKAVQLEPASSDFNLWLGRACGRRAETSSFLTAPHYAGKTREYFEKALGLNPRNTEAAGDLFDYYLQAPGFLGGGEDKAKALAEKTKDLDPAEYHCRLARIAGKRKEYSTAEEQLRRAMQLAPKEVGRVIDLAKFLARQGKYQESDRAFQEAERIGPDDPKLLFARAEAYVQAKRNLEKARELLVRYLNAPLTPDDPPRREAERLLKRARSG